MVFASPLKSFQVDSLSKRWVAFLLLILLWGVSFWFYKFPPGDPDFSAYVDWAEEMMDADDYYEAYSRHPLDSVVTWGNVLYACCAILFLFFLQLVIWFYFVLYSCDARKVPLSKAVGIFFTRIWWMLLFCMAAVIPFFLLVSVLPVVLLFYFPALYAVSGLVFMDKVNPFSAIPKSMRKTFGHKMPIFLDLCVIFFILFACMNFSGLLLHAGSTGMALVNSFLTAYFTLVIARNMGIRYQMITLLSRE